MNVSRYGNLSVRHIRVAPGLLVMLVLMSVYTEPASGQG